jgi:hypothetical protein
MPIPKTRKSAPNKVRMATPGAIIGPAMASTNTRVRRSIQFPVGFPKEAVIAVAAPVVFDPLTPLGRAPIGLDCNGALPPKVK